MFDWIFSLFLPPVITNIFNLFRHGNNSITGKWVHISYMDEDCKEENLYAVLEIKRSGNGFIIDGDSYFPEQTEKGFYPRKDSFYGDLCQLKGRTFEFVTQAGDSNSLTRTHGKFNFGKFGFKPPKNYDGYYIKNKKRPVRGMKLTKKLSEEHNITSNEEALHSLIPILQGTKAGPKQTALAAQSAISFKSLSDCKQPLQIVEQAKNNLFISGGHYRHWVETFDIIVSRTELKTRIIVLDFSNPDLHNAYIALRGDDKYDGSRLYLRELVGHSHIEIRETNFITPTYFASTDMYTDDGYIRARYLTNNPNRSTTHCVELTPNHGEWYESYRKQIEIIWERAKPVEWK